MKELMIVELYRASHYDIYELKSSLKNKNHFMSDKIGLPTYCFNEKGNIIDFCEEYLQFVGLIKEDSPENEYIYMFDIVFKTNILEEEISYVGIREEYFNFYKLIEKFGVTTEIPLHVTDKRIIINDFKHRRIPVQLILIYDVNYYGSGDDFDSEVIFKGYLDDNLKEINI